MRSAVRALVGVLLAVAVTGCTSIATPPRTQPERASAPGASPAGPPSSTASSGPSSPGSSGPQRPGTSGPLSQLATSRLTPQGFWWAVDSTIALSTRSLGNVRGFYRATRNPVAWGRYLVGSYAVRPAELTFAARHHLALYFLVPDKDCSECAGGGDRCGNDRTAGQARQDARHAISAAHRLRLPRGVALFKDLEQVGSCYGELSKHYVLAWFRRVRRSEYRPAFYGNTTAQSYDFPRAFCAAAAADRAFASHVVLAQDEPEPDIGAGAGTIGPRNAPRFAPKHPRCTTRAATSIWQYGESISDDNDTDVDEIRPGTPGLLAADGSVTG